MTFIQGRQSQCIKRAARATFIGDKGIGSTIEPSDLNNFARDSHRLSIDSQNRNPLGYGIFYDQNPAIANNRAAADSRSYSRPCWLALYRFRIRMEAALP